jgi:phytoene dehydrogenase-like protein
MLTVNGAGNPGLTKADVIVIGAGHNGLVAACYLARAGLEVLVVEAAPTVGGMSATAAVIPQAPAHRVNTGAVDMVFLRASGVVEELGLPALGYQDVDVDPPVVFLHPDGSSIAFWRDPARTAAEIRAFSRADAATFIELSQTLETVLDAALPLMMTNPCRPAPSALGRAAAAALRHPRRAAGIRSLLVSAADYIDARFQHPVVRDALAVVGGVQGPITEDFSAIYLMLLAFTSRCGAMRAIGGTQTLPDAMVTALQRLGGRVRTGAPVAEILLTGGRATGVRLTGGEELIAHKAVLSTCDPKSTLGQLLPAGTLSPTLEARVADIPTSHGGRMSHFKVDLALSGRINPARHEQGRGDGLDLRSPALILGGFQQTLATYRSSCAGEIPEHPPMWVVVPTAVDPSQAPEGQDTVYVWGNLMPLHPRRGWQSCSAEAQAMLMGEAESIYGPLEALEIGRFVQTPDDFARVLRVTDGTLQHVDQVLTRSGPLRPARGLSGYRTPVPGLFLGGAGSHPAYGVTCVPGRNSAREILRSLRAADPAARPTSPLTSTAPQVEPVAAEAARC